MNKAINALFLVGVLINCIKAAEIILRPDQQKWLQDKFERLTLWLEYTRPMSWIGKLGSPIGKYILLALTCIFYLPFLFSDLLELRVGKVHWLLKIANLLVTLLTILVLVQWVGPRFTKFIFRAMKHTDLDRAYPLQAIVVFILALVWPFICAPVVLIAAHVFALKHEVLISFYWFLTLPVTFASMMIFGSSFLLLYVMVIFLVLEVVLKIVRAFAWRIVEYNRGVLAAVVLLTTVVLGLVNLYLQK